MKLYPYLLLFLLPFQAFTQQKPMLISEEDLEIDTELQAPKEKSYRNYTYKRDTQGNILESIETYRSDAYPEEKNNTKFTYTYDSKGNELSSVRQSWSSSTKVWCCQLIHEYTYEGKKMVTTKFSKELTGKIVPQWIENFKYDTNGNRIGSLYQTYDTLLNKYVDATLFAITYNLKKQILNESYSYRTNNKWLEASKTEYTYNSTDSLEVKTEHRNYLKELDNMGDKVTAEGWKIKSVIKWVYNPQGIDIGNVVSVPHPLSGELTATETEEYLRDANGNMTAYAQVIAGFNKEDKLEPISAKRQTILYSSGGSTITNNEMCQYYNTALGQFSVAHVYTLKYDGVIQKGAAPAYDKKLSE